MTRFGQKGTAGGAPGERRLQGGVLASSARCGRVKVRPTSPGAALKAWGLQLASSAARYGYAVPGLPCEWWRC